ncbi:hypothetical protein ILUMI_12742 [Ignelater luminosus]|uniref:CRAL-TRIO domain-containing protein n=1 Tax=Ignelater luminosus TaxID=2038154 RepID=A0A8K0GBH9_IGNLU|nr:hypothetical protein ILUMI_12742 [Ignelater luminosus]
MIADIMLLDNDAFLVNGQEIIYDFEEIPYSFVTQLTPYFLKNVITICVEAYATRLKGLYCINVPSAVGTIINFCKALFSEKLKSRVHVYSKDDLDKLYHHIPKSSLPEEYGGSAGTSAKLSIIRSGSKKDSQVKTWEIPLDSFNIEGSFRKLDVD